MRLPDQALGRVGGAGERALGVAEELRLQQLGRDRAAVDRDERPVRAVTRAVDVARDQLLAGAALAPDQDVRVGRRNLADELRHPAHARRRADHAPVGPGLAQAALQERVLAADPPFGERALDRMQEVVVVERLDDVVDRAVAQRLDRALHRRVARHEDDRQLAVELAQGPDRVEPGRVRQLEVGDHEVDRDRVHRPHAVPDRAGRLGAIALAREEQLHDLREPGVVVDHQDPLPALDLESRSPARFMTPPPAARSGNRRRRRERSPRGGRRRARARSRSRSRGRARRRRRSWW